MAVDAKSWTRDGASYRGTIGLVPDRGYNVSGTSEWGGARAGVPDRRLASFHRASLLPVFIAASLNQASVLLPRDAGCQFASSSVPSL